MRKIIKAATQNPLISGSAIIFLGSNLGNVFNLLFNFFMVRNLSDADFGVLTSLNSIITLTLLVATSLMPIVVNFAAEYFAQNKLDLVHGLWVKLAKYYYSFCALLLLIFLFATPQLSDFFHISEFHLIFITGIIVFFGLIATLNMAFNQAKLAFMFIAVVTLVVAVVKFVFGYLFVILGLGVGGGMWAILLSLLLLFLLTFIPIRFIFRRKTEPSPVPAKELLTYGIPSALSILALTSLISTDIFLVKHFFPPAQAGVYASVELVGKIVFFLTSSIPTVLFPVIVQKKAKGESFHRTFLLAVGLVLLPSILVTLTYFLFPDFVLTTIIKKASVVAYSNLLGFFGVVMSLYSLAVVFVYFYLSIGKTKVTYFVLAAAILQAASIWIYHNSFLDVLRVSFFVIFLLLVGLLLYYPNATKK